MKSTARTAAARVSGIGPAVLVAAIARLLDWISSPPVADGPCDPGMQMKLAREFPPNPHAVLFHADARLTDEIVRTWFPDGAAIAPAPTWATGLLGVAGLRVLSVNAYKIRIQKRREVGWCELLPRLERVLRDELTVGAEIPDLRDSECRRRAFAWHGPPLSRRVFEGRHSARTDPIAGALFELPGVAEVILDGHCVEVRKSPLFLWSDLAGPVEARIDQARG